MFLALGLGLTGVFAFKTHKLQKTTHLIDGADAEYQNGHDFYIFHPYDVTGMVEGEDFFCDTDPSQVCVWGYTGDFPWTDGSNDEFIVIPNSALSNLTVIDAGDFVNVDCPTL